MNAKSCRHVCSSGRLPCSLSRLFSSPLSLSGVVTMFRVCLPRALALRQVLEAMRLFLVERSSDRLASGDRFLSP